MLQRSDPENSMPVPDHRGNSSTRHAVSTQASSRMDFPDNRGMPEETQRV